MYNLTPEQKKAIETATESLSRDIDLLIDQIKKEGDTEKRKSLTANLAALVVQRIATEKDLQQRFKEDQLRALGDPELIIKDACAVADYEIVVLFKGLTMTAEDITEDAQREAVAFFMDPASDEPKLNAEKVFVYLTEFCDAFEAGCEALAPHFRVIETFWPSEKDALEEAVKGAILTHEHIAPGAITKTSENNLAARIPFSLKAPKTYSLLNDKINNRLLFPPSRENAINGQIQMVWGINQARSGSGELPVYVSLQYMGSQGLPSNYTAFDQAVYDAISTMFFYSKAQGSEALDFTPSEIWRFMNAQPITNTHAKPSAQQLQKVCNSIEKMRWTEINIDISQELKARSLVFDDARIQSGNISTSLLSIDKLRMITEKGKEITAYRLKEEPILYTYAKAKKHILWIDYKRLDTSEAGNEGNSVEIKSYLLKQITLMQNGSRDNTKILFDTLYKSTGLPAPADRVSREKHKTEGSYKTAIKKETAKDRDKILALLEIWEKQGLIKNYRLVKSGRTFSGVDIELLDEHTDSKKIDGKMGTNRRKNGYQKPKIDGKMGTNRRKNGYRSQ